MRKVMFIIITFLICVIFTKASNAESMFNSFFKKNNAKQAVSDNHSNNNPEIYHDPIITPYSNQVMIPVSYHTEKNGMLSTTKSSDTYWSSSSKKIFIYYGMETCKFENFVFYNQLTGKSKLLFDKQRMVSAFYYPHSEDEKGSDLPKFLLFGINKDDTNQNGQVDIDDAKVAYISDLDGNNLIQITPNGTKLLSWEINKDNGDIYLRVKHDTNGDAKFNDNDKISIYKVKSSSPGMGIEIVSQSIREQLANIQSVI